MSDTALTGKRDCPHCRAQIDAKARVCQHCGRDVTAWGEVERAGKFAANSSVIGWLMVFGFIAIAVGASYAL